MSNIPEVKIVSSTIEDILGSQDFKKRDEFKTEKSKAKFTQDDLLSEQVAEQRQRRNFRRIMFWLFFLLLIGQHILLSWFTIHMILHGMFNDAAPLLKIVIPATLGETFFVIKVMVKFIFSPGNFENKNTILNKK